MKLKNLRVIDDTPKKVSSKKIKDALIEVPDDVLLKIIQDYNKENQLKQIYKNDETGIEALKSDYEVQGDIPSEDSFAFVTPNQYGGIEGISNLKEVVDIEKEVLPFVEANYQDYEEDLQIHDDDVPVFDLDWFKENWRKGKVGQERLNNILRIARKVYDYDFELYKKVSKVLEQFKTHMNNYGRSNDNGYDYNEAKKDLIRIFSENMQESASEISEQEKSQLRKEAIDAYNKRYDKDLDPEKGGYNDLPDEWKNKLNPLIKSGRKETFKKVLKELSSTMSEKESETHSVEDLKKKFKEIFGFYYEDKNISNFAASNDLESPSVRTCFDETLKAFEEGKITFKEAKNYFQTVYEMPSYYKSACSKWFKVNSKDPKAKKVEEYKIDKDMDKLEEAIKKIKANEQWNAYYEEHKKAMKELYEEETWTKEEYLEEIKDLVEYCVSKIDKTEGTQEEEQLNKILKEIEDKGVQKEKVNWIKAYYTTRQASKKKDAFKKIEKLAKQIANATNIKDIINKCKSADELNKLIETTDFDTLVKQSQTEEQSQETSKPKKAKAQK